MALFQGSRYIKTPAYVRRGETLVFRIRNRIHFNDSLCKYYTVIQGDTIDGIAYKQYNNAKLWWAIMDANPSLQSELDLKVGAILKIPSFEEVVKFSE